MLVNNKNIDIFKCRCIKFTPNSSTYKNNSIVYTCNNINPFKGMNVEELRTVETIFIFYGSKENIQKNISRFIEEIKYSIVNIGSFYYEINIKTTSEPTVLTNNSCKLNLTFDLFNMYESEKSITIRNEYVLRLFILSKSLLKSETDNFFDCILLDKSLTLSILSKFTVLFDTRLVKE